MARPGAAAVDERPEWRGLSAAEVVRRVCAGDAPLFAVLMRRYNQRLYRVARAILRDDREAEDVMQHAYVEGSMDDSRRRPVSLPHRGPSAGDPRE